jgi:hypothetical protein
MFWALISISAHLWRKTGIRHRIATNLTNRHSVLGFNEHPWRKRGIRHRIATNLTNRHSVLGCNAHSWCFLKTSRRMRHRLNSFLLWILKFHSLPKLIIYKGWISSSLKGFQDIDGLGLIAKPWDWSDGDIAIRTSLLWLEDAFFSSFGWS